MDKTNHCKQRMSQRGINGKMLDLVLKFGESCGDKLILNKKLVLKYIKEIDEIRADLMKVLDKGGVTAVAEDNAILTVYNTNSFKRV